MAQKPPLCDHCRRLTKALRGQKLSAMANKMAIEETNFHNPTPWREACNFVLLGRKLRPTSPKTRRSSLYPRQRDRRWPTPIRPIGTLGMDQQALLGLTYGRHDPNTNWRPPVSFDPNFSHPRVNLVTGLSCGPFYPRYTGDHFQCVGDIYEGASENTETPYEIIAVGKILLEHNLAPIRINFRSRPT